MQTVIARQRVARTQEVNRNHRKSVAPIKLFVEAVTIPFNLAVPPTLLARADEVIE